MFLPSCLQDGCHQLLLPSVCYCMFLTECRLLLLHAAQFHQDTMSYWFHFQLTTDCSSHPPSMLFTSQPPFSFISFLHKKAGLCNRDHLRLWIERRDIIALVLQSQTSLRMISELQYKDGVFPECTANVIGFSNSKETNEMPLIFWWYIHVQTFPDLYDYCDPLLYNNEYRWHLPV